MVLNKYIINQIKKIMICYKDMTFCTYYKDCKNAGKCHRPLTTKVREAAERWMENAPICQFAEKPNCYEIKKVLTK